MITLSICLFIVFVLWLAGDVVTWWKLDEQERERTRVEKEPVAHVDFTVPYWSTSFHSRTTEPLQYPE